MKVIRRILAACALSCVLLLPLIARAQTAPTLSATSATLAWTASPDSSVTGYYLYFGDVTGTTTNQVNVGMAVTWTVTNLQPGATYFFFVTAHNAAGTESDPSNLVLESVPVFYPDLAVTAIACNPATPTEGDGVQFSAVITNQGEVAVLAGSSFRIGFAVDGQPVSAWGAVSGGLQPGDSVTVVATGGTNSSGLWTALSGWHSIGVTVDDLGTIAESVETNNTLQTMVLVATAPPPSISITADKVTVAESDSAGVLVTLHRSGSVLAALNVGLKSSGSSQSGINYVALPDAVLIPAGSTSATFRLIPLKDGVEDNGKTLNVSLVTDGSYEIGTPNGIQLLIANSDTATDAAQRTIVPPPQTLTLAWDASPSGVIAGYYLYYGVVGGTQTNRVDAGNALMASVTNLAAGTTYFFFATAYAASGLESDPSNLITYTIATPGAPDLMITAITPTPGAPVAGQPVRFCATIMNHGTVNVAEGASIRVGFSVDGAPTTFWCALDGPLLAGAAATITAQQGGADGGAWLAVAGTHTVTAVVDDLGEFPEANETNNLFQATLVVRAAAPIDSDGDGMSDAAEALAGTDPLDPKSNLHIESLLKSVTGGMTLSWASVPGITYQVLSRGSLEDSNWTIASPTITATGNSTAWSFSPTNAAGFFMMTVVPGSGN